jgi:hypothetical protein
LAAIETASLNHPVDTADDGMIPRGAGGMTRASPSHPDLEAYRRALSELMRKGVFVREIELKSGGGR